jgi:hypothetical protein
MISALDGVSGQHHALATLYPGERTPGTHCTGGWVALEPVWTQRLDEKVLCLCCGSNLDHLVIVNTEQISYIISTQ